MGIERGNGKVDYPLILNIIFFIFGLVLIISPKTGLVNVTIILAICLFCVTLILVGVFFANRRRNELLLLAAAGTLILGILMLYFRDPIGTVILPIIAGVWMIASAALSVAAAFKYKKIGILIWWLPLVAALVAVILALLIFFNLGATAVFLSVILGIYFLVFNAIKVGEWFTIERLIK